MPRVAPVVLFLILAQCAYSQENTSQVYRVIVANSTTVEAPSTSTSVVHDETDNDQIFPDQTWSVFGNTANGIVVTFAATEAFVNLDNPTYKRDVELSLAIGSTNGPASWNLTTASDQTNYQVGDESASVSAASDGVGRASLNLTVKFLTGNFGTFATGEYSTTIVGTASAQ